MESASQKAKFHCTLQKYGERKKGSSGALTDGRNDGNSPVGGRGRSVGRSPRQEVGMLSRDFFLA